MKKLFFFSVMFVTSILLVFLVISHQQEGEEPPTEKRERDAQIVDEKRDISAEIGEPEMIAAREGPILESPLLQDEYAEEVRREIQEKGRFRKNVDGVKMHIPLFFEGAHPEIPMVELRFLQEKQNGELEPVYIESLKSAWRIGRTSKLIFPDKYRISVPFSSAKHTLRFGAGPPGTGETFLFFGKRYHLNYKAIDPDTGEVDFYDSIIKVPDHIPDGKMAVIEVIARHLTEDRVITSSPEDEKESITGVVNRPLPPTNAEWFVAYNHSEKSESGAKRIDSDGSFDLGERKLGGMLRIVEKGGHGVAWMIARSVQKNHLNLPGDADRVINREAIRHVGIEVPEEYINEDLVGVWLKEGKDDTGPIAAKAYRSASSEEFQEFLSTKILRMNVSPGRYWVSAFYDPGVVDGEWGKEWKTLGQVTIPEEDSEEAIPIQPQ